MDIDRPVKSVIIVPQRLLHQLGSIMPAMNAVIPTVIRITATMLNSICSRRL